MGLREWIRSKRQPLPRSLPVEMKTQDWVRIMPQENGTVIYLRFRKGMESLAQVILAPEAFDLLRKGVACDIALHGYEAHCKFKHV